MTVQMTDTEHAYIDNMQNIDDGGNLTKQEKLERKKEWEKEVEGLRSNVLTAKPLIKHVLPSQPADVREKNPSLLNFV